MQDTFARATHSAKRARDDRVSCIQLPGGKFKLIMTIKLSIYILKNRYTLLVEKNVKIIVGKSERRRPGRLGFENLNAPGQGEF